MTKPMRNAHLVWAAVGLVACGLLVFGGGHPPPIIFMPVVVMIWVAGHGVLWGAATLAARGRAEAGGVKRTMCKWPLGLRFALFATGAAACIGLVQLAGSMILGRTYPFHGLLWVSTMAVWVFHGGCFVGLLLRRRWSKLACALASMGWALLTGVRIADYLVKGQRVNLMEMTSASGLTVALAGFGLYLLLSRRVDSFFPARG